MNEPLALIRDEAQTAAGPRFDYLRVSVTTQCQLHCAYCRSGLDSGSGAREGAAAAEASRPLPPAKLVECCAALCAATPIRKIRLSGGEPLLAPELPDVIAALAALPQRPQVVATTNGVLLVERASELRAAGLERLNISLDTAGRDDYARLTGIDALPRVLEGLAAAHDAGFRGTKLNAVLTRSTTADAFRRLIEVAADHGAEVRLIELMPIGPGRALHATNFIAAAEAEDTFHRAGLTRPRDGATEARERFIGLLPDGREVPVAIIASMTRPFCADCRRIRLSSDGKLIPCLLSPLRLALVGDDGAVPGADEVERLLRRCAALKCRATAQIQERMWAIGG